MDDETIDCDAVLRDIHEFLAHEQTPEGAARIRGHLDDCSHCLEEADFEAELRAVVKECCSAPPPPGLAERIRGMLR